MQRLLPYSKKPLLGLDINPAYVTLLGLVRHANQLHCDRFSLQSLPARGTSERGALQPLTLLERLKHVAQQSGGRIKKIATALEGGAVYTRVLTLPATLSDVAMEHQVRLAAQDAFPDVAEALSVDFQVLRLNHQDPEQVDVLMVACDQHAVSERVTLLKDAGFKTNVVDVDVYALQRACGFFLESNPVAAHQTVAFLHLNRNQAILVVIREGELLYSKNQPVNNQECLRQAKQILAIDDWLGGDAQKASTLGLSGTDQLLSLFVPAVSTQVRQMLQYFYSAVGQNPVSKVYLTGEMAIVNGLSDEVEDTLNMPVSVANPFLTMPISKRVDAAQIKAIGPALMLCLGLALRGVQDD